MFFLAYGREMEIPKVSVEKLGLARELIKIKTNDYAGKQTGKQWIVKNSH